MARLLCSSLWRSGRVRVASTRSPTSAPATRYPAHANKGNAAYGPAGRRYASIQSGNGDSHAAWANDLHDADGALVAAEFGATAISSPSYGSIVPGIGKYIAEANEEVAFCDQDGKGYLLLTLDREGATAEFATVSTVMAKPFQRRTSARYRARPVRPGGRASRLEAI